MLFVTFYVYIYINIKYLIIQVTYLVQIKFQVINLYKCNYNLYFYY